jgi:hypothetical protein
MATPGPLDQAWRIHAALVDWTGKVDFKASFALTLESALIAGAVVLSEKNHRLGSIGSLTIVVIYTIGFVLLSLGALLAVSVVVPRLRGSKLKAEWRSNYIYFGHLRHWKPTELEVALREGQIMPVLTRQLVNMSQIAWQKHRRVQISFLLAISGSAAIALAAVLNSKP